MRTITKYKAYDGEEFTSKTKCEEYERRARAADVLIAILPKKPEGTDFANGGGFIQHDFHQFYQVREGLIRLALAEVDHHWLKESLADATVHPSYAGRIIDECCNERLKAAWYRFHCTDVRLREWGQPYFASHPMEGKQIQLN